jgi:hypothetical protein
LQDCDGREQKMERESFDETPDRELGDGAAIRIAVAMPPISISEKSLPSRSSTSFGTAMVAMWKTSPADSAIMTKSAKIIAARNGGSRTSGVEGRCSPE